MQRLIDGLARPSLPPLSGRLLRRLDDGVIERDGSVLLRALGREAVFDAARHVDRTAFECAVNAIEFDAAPLEAERALATALTYAGQLVEMLDRSGCAGSFRVILAQDAADQSCRVSFHRLRPGESSGAEDLDAAGDRAILLLDCGEDSRR
ncbi:MAG TPA: hypothetical protein VN668_05880 [Stellaceae bacterium]|nr:hypothetical protein [Stellaceae bacterium]